LVTLDFGAERPANFFIAARELPSLNEILCCHRNLVTGEAGDLRNCSATQIHNRSHARFAVIAEEDDHGKAAHRNRATPCGCTYFFLRRFDRNRSDRHSLAPALSEQFLHSRVCERNLLGLMFLLFRKWIERQPTSFFGLGLLRMRS
jgi:hypothetical protein